MKLFDDTSKNILENFQNAYFEQIGRRMTIGSEEYILSSIFTYVLASYIALMNKAYDNRFLATAAGEYLDNIAKQYNLDRKPVTFGNPFFEGQFKFTTGYKDINALEINLAGHIYKNDLAIIGNNTVEFVRFTCVEDHSEYLDAQTLIELLQKQDIVAAHIAGNGLQSCSNALTNDEEFRNYINQNKQLYNPGIAGSFEAVAKSYADYISDAKVIRQNETEFVPGHIDLVIKIDDTVVKEHFNSDSLDYKGIEKAIEDLHILTVGQELHILSAIEQQIAAGRVRVQVYIPKTFNQNESADLSTVRLKHSALAHYFNYHKIKIGQAFYVSELLNAMTQPLSNISTNPADFGLTASEYNLLNTFNIRGYNVSTGEDRLIPTSNLHYIKLLGFNYAQPIYVD